MKGMIFFMGNDQYQMIVDANLPKEDRFKNLIIAFFIGGLIGLFGNFLVDFYSYKLGLSTSDAGVMMLTTLIFIACLLTALGFFDDFVKFGKMGVIIPITGFAHSVQSAALDYKNEGLIYGLGSNIFKLAGSVVLYGVVSATIVGIIRYFIFGG